MSWSEFLLLGKQDKHVSGSGHHSRVNSNPKNFLNNVVVNNPSQKHSVQLIISHVIIRTVTSRILQDNTDYCCCLGFVVSLASQPNEPFRSSH